MSKTTIDITPTWRATMSAYAMVLSIGDAEGQRIAREELLGIGDWLDEFKKIDWDLILDAAAENTSEQVQAAVSDVRIWLADDDDEEVQA